MFGKKATLLSALMVIILLLATACSTPAATIAPTTAPAQTDAPAATVEPTADAKWWGDEVTEIKVFWPWGGPANPAVTPDSEFSDYLAETIGVRIISEPAQSDPEQVLTLARASKSLPDITFMPVNLTNAILWYSEGNVIDLAPYFKDPARFPNLAKVTPSTLSFFQDDNGVQVCIPAGGNVSADLNAPLNEKAMFSAQSAYGYFARKDLLDTFGKEIKTLADMDAYLRSTVDKKATDGTNVIPLGVPRWAASPNFEWFLPIFGGRQGSMVDASGNIVVMETSKPWYDMMKQMNAWFKDDLISPEVFTDDWSMYESKIAASKFGMVYGSSWAMLSYNNKIADEATHYVPVPYMMADGVEYLLANPAAEANPYNMGWAMISISSACKNPDAAMRFIDYVSSPDGSISTQAGMPGTHWEWTNDEHTEWQLLEPGKKVHSAGGDPDWITNAGTLGIFPLYQYGLSDLSGINMAGEVRDPFYTLCFDAWAGHAGTLYGHRRASLDMTTASEKATLENTNFETPRSQWVLGLIEAKADEFDAAYQKGITDNAGSLKIFQEEYTAAWNTFKAKHSDLPDDAKWYGPVERAATLP